MTEELEVFGALVFGELCVPFLLFSKIRVDKFQKTSNYCGTMYNWYLITNAALLTIFYTR